MLKNLLARVGLGTAATAALAAPPPPVSPIQRPYAEAHLNFLYNLLFCDDIELFRRDTDAACEPPWRTLLADAPAEAALRRIAEEADGESRVRALAFRRLRQLGYEVAPKILLGAIVEVPLERGLDTLAAYADGRVRYLNQAGAASIFEGGPAAVETLARDVIAAALPLVQRIGPWHDARLPPPPAGAVRLSFLVSDGLYFGQGTFTQLEQDALAGPVLAKAGELLQVVVAAATR
jgi:hypothetical protein